MKMIDVVGLILSATGAVVLGVANMRHAEDSAKEAVDKAFEIAQKDDDEIE